MQKFFLIHIFVACMFISLTNTTRAAVMYYPPQPIIIPQPRMVITPMQTQACSNAVLIYSSARAEFMGTRAVFLQAQSATALSNIMIPLQNSVNKLKFGETNCLLNCRMTPARCALFGANLIMGGGYGGIMRPMGSGVNVNIYN